MKIATNIVGGLLGLAFIAFSLMVLLHLVTPPPPPEGSMVAMFMTVFATSGWLIMVKVCELIGGILVAIPKTRNFGLLVLGPIIINIITFHLLVEKGDVAVPAFLGVLALFLLWAERKSFLGLLH
jgi:putative oxidoreductase